MKVYVSMILLMMLSLSGFAQSLDEKLGLFNHADLYDQLSFDINIELDSNAHANEECIFVVGLFKISKP